MAVCQVCAGVSLICPTGSAFIACGLGTWHLGLCPVPEWLLCCGTMLATVALCVFMACQALCPVDTHGHPCWGRQDACPIHE